MLKNRSISQSISKKYSKSTNSSPICAKNPLKPATKKNKSRLQHDTSDWTNVLQ